MNTIIKRIKNNIDNLVTERELEIIQIILRVGVAIAFIYPAVEGLFYPNAWIGFFPLWLRNLPIDDILMLHIFGASEIIIALWILFGKKIFIPSVLASGYMFFIVVFDWKYMDLLFRDIAIFAISSSLAVMSYPWKLTESDILKKYYTKKSAIIGLLVTIAIISVGINLSLYQKGYFKEKEEGTYTILDVAQHNKVDDCWLIVDGKVFNMTEASKGHPSLFTCGGDGSENYHKNHGPGIRSRMDPFFIGNLDSDSLNQLAARKAEDFKKAAEGSAINPHPELFALEGSWNPLDLMMVMERDNHALLAIDGSTNKAIGRIKDIGFQPHTQVFSPDGNYTYHISRDGWLTKIDLRTLEEVKHVRVGAVSRGTGLTDDGKYVAIGNYEPQNVVILNTETLEIVKTIDLFDIRGEKTVRSRAGAVVESGSKIFVALKDLQSVWVIDTAQRGFPVTNYFWDIGKEGDTLHDAYLTPDGKFFIAAVQGSDYVWVLNTETMKEVARVKTGKTPHTGPGATWGNYTFVPALGEGKITAIDMTTWTPAAFIPTAGPGLFVRSFGKDPLYPYILADASLASEGDDEIYVIDGDTLTVKKTLIPMPGKKAVHPEFTRDGKYIYIGVWGGDKVYVYDSKTFDVVTTIDAVTPTGVSNVGLRIEEPGL